MSEKKRKAFSAQQKTKVALEAIRGIKMVNEINVIIQIVNTCGSNII